MRQRLPCVQFNRTEAARRTGKSRASGQPTQATVHNWGLCNVRNADLSDRPRIDDLDNDKGSRTLETALQPSFHTAFFEA
jgi:hypothetical protein